MRNYIKVVVIGGILITLFFIFKGFYSNLHINTKDSKLSWNIKYKGFKDAVDFVIDENGNYYIAYKDSIQYIEKSGKSYDILKNKDLNIKSIDYKDNRLYYISDNKAFCYDLDKKNQKLLVGDLPNYGDYKDSIIRIKDSNIYISIGAATNSGIVGKDNLWKTDNPFYYDISPKDIIVKGKNFGTEKTGAFVPYNTKNSTGQLIPGHFPGNASIINYNLSNGSTTTYAWGIRNIKGMAFNSQGNIMATVGGMEDRGLRPVKGDVDYIYEIKKGLWYGWPDYSGGDPVTSPRFKGENNNRLSFILDNHPTTNPPAPLYQHKSLASLGVMDIDTEGKVGEKDCIYFYDTRDNILYGLTKEGILSEKAQLGSNAAISAIRVQGSSILLLNSFDGVLYDFHISNSNKMLLLNKYIFYYLIIAASIGIIITVWRFNDNKANNT